MPQHTMLLCPAHLAWGTQWTNVMASLSNKPKKKKKKKNKKKKKKKEKEQEEQKKRSENIGVGGAYPSCLYPAQKASCG